MNSNFSDIPDAHNWSSIDEVHKGWSRDKKFHITTIDGRELLLRTSDYSHYDKKHQEFEAVTTA